MNKSVARLYTIKLEHVHSNCEHLENKLEISEFIF